MLLGINLSNMERLLGFLVYFMRWIKLWCWILLSFSIVVFSLDWFFFFNFVMEYCSIVNMVLLGRMVFLMLLNFMVWWMVLFRFWLKFLLGVVMMDVVVWIFFVERFRVLKYFEKRVIVLDWIGCWWWIR